MRACVMSESSFLRSCGGGERLYSSVISTCMMMLRYDV